jgi:hypothetical protein
MLAKTPEEVATKRSGYAFEVMRRQPDGGWRFFIGDPFTISSNR